MYLYRKEGLIMGDPKKKTRKSESLETAPDVPEETPEYSARGKNANRFSALNPRQNLLISLPTALARRQRQLPCESCGDVPACAFGNCPYL